MLIHFGHASAVFVGLRGNSSYWALVILAAMWFRFLGSALFYVRAFVFEVGGVYSTSDVGSSSCVPSPAGQGLCVLFGGSVASRWLPETRTRNLLHVLVGGWAFGLVGRRSWGGSARELKHSHRLSQASWRACSFLLGGMMLFY